MAIMAIFLHVHIGRFCFTRNLRSLTKAIGIAVVFDRAVAGLSTILLLLLIIILIILILLNVVVVVILLLPTVLLLAVIVIISISCVKRIILRLLTGPFVLLEKWGDNSQTCSPISSLVDMA